MGLELSAITGVILAGGRGSRMGHQAKGLIRYCGQPMIAHVIQRFAPQVTTLQINANQHIALHTQFGYPVFSDRSQSYDGPLAGVLAAFDHCQTDWIITVPTDAPLLPMQLVARLIQNVSQPQIYAAHCQQHWQPLFALWPRACQPALEKFLANGQRSVQEFLQQQHAIGVDFSDQSAAFANINTPAQLQAMSNTCPVLGFVAWSGSGKTTLLTQVIPILREAGLRIGLIKHAHHQFDIDIPGKDSYELRKAGAGQVLVASQYRWALMTETPQQTTDPDLDELVSHLDHQQLDIILVEGFKHAHFPKIEVHRSTQQQPLLCSSDADIIAVATDVTSLAAIQIPLLDLNQPSEVAAFIRHWLLDQPTPALA